MAKSAPSTAKFSKVVIAAKRGTDRLEVFRGFGVLSHKGIVLEAYKDDFPYALGRLNLLNDHLPVSRRSSLVGVVAVVMKIGTREIQQVSREAKKGTEDRSCRVQK